MIANAGGGEYLELDREGDREISNRIIDATRRRAGSRGLEVANEELYWRLLLAAAAFGAVGLLFLQERVELWLQAAGAGAALALVWTRPDEDQERDLFARQKNRRSEGQKKFSFSLAVKGLPPGTWLVGNLKISSDLRSSDLSVRRF